MVEQQTRRNIFFTGKETGQGIIRDGMRDFQPARVSEYQKQVIHPANVDEAIVPMERLNGIQSISFIKSYNMPTDHRLFAENPEIQETIDNAVLQIQQVPGFEHVRFIIFYGSAQRRQMTIESDIDLCMYYDGDRADAGKFRHAVLSRLPGIRYDVKIFQQLPLYIRIEVLKGTPVFIRDITFLYEIANQTLREFDDFKHRLYDYTGQAAIS